ncbi:MAG: ATP-binding protein [Nanobdellota archaeon]
MRTWFEEYGYRKNPLSTKPSLVLYGIEELYTRLRRKIQGGKRILLLGEYGTGKTSLLKKVIKEFGGRRKVIYYNCNKDDCHIDFKALIKGSGNLIQRLFGIRKKGLILLVDEADLLKKRDMENLEFHFSKGDFRAVVFAATGMISSVDEVIRTGSIGEKDAVSMIRKRIGHDLISEGMIKEILRKDDNPRRFLKNVEAFCRERCEAQK